MTTASAGARPLGRLASFVLDDHRYVLLGTSVIAAMGMSLSSQPRPALSFLAGAYALEVVLYYLLVAWLVLAAVALAFKLARWKTYAQVSPFTQPTVARALRYGSYAVCGITAVLALDRLGMGIASAWQVAVTAETRPASTLESMLYMLYNSRAIFFSGFKTTVALAVFGTVIAFFLALLLVFLRIQVIDRSDNDFVRFWKVVGSGFARLYSTVVRGTPMMVQAMIIFFGVFALFKMTDLTTTQINAIWSTFTAGLVTIVLNSTAYMMEVLRGGIESVDTGQTEAARSLGLSSSQTMMRIVLPQAFKNVLPAMCNEFVAVTKETSLASTFYVGDLMTQYQTISGKTYLVIEPLIIIGVIYFVVTFTMSKLVAVLERRLKTDD